MFSVEPIGYFHSSFPMRYQVPRQPTFKIQNKGVIYLQPYKNYEQCLEGLSGFDRIWIIFRFHDAFQWKTKVMPPRGGKKQGVFATRSPHRPNFIGMSSVQLLEIKGLQLFIANHDLIDQTPILDLKPYLNYADAHHSNRQGWLEDLEPEKTWMVEWSVFANEQINYLRECGINEIKEEIEMRLQTSPFPYPNNRIKKTNEKDYQLSYQTWRIEFTVVDQTILIKEIKSGYDQETLKGKKISKWSDVDIHRQFVKKFYH